MATSTKRRPPSTHGELRHYWRGCRCRPCKNAHNASLRERRRQHPRYVKTMNLRRFGLTYDQWRAMVRRYRNRCAACGQAERGRNQYGRMSLAIDHDHKTGRVRGLLCHRCNRALGLLGDSAARLVQLLRYRKVYG